MTTISEAHSLRNGRQVVVVVNDAKKQARGVRSRRDPDDEIRAVSLDDLLENLFERHNSSPFSKADLAEALEETIDEEGVTVTIRGALYAAGQLVDPGQLGNAQLGTTPSWEYRLASYVRDAYQ